MILGADPGNMGGLVLLNMEGKIEQFLCMPLSKQNNKAYDKPEIDTVVLHNWLKSLKGFPKFVICERPTTYGMMAGSAFWYGFGFHALSKQLEQFAGLNRVHYVNPAEWTKEMHSGKDKDLKAKVKSKIVFEELFSWETFGKMKKSSAEGLMDAALMAEFGRRNASRYEALSAT